MSGISKDSGADGDGEIEDFAYAMTKGTLNVESLDKKATREFIDKVRAAIIAENENMPAATRATHRELANWMQDCLPNGLPTCR